MKTQHPITVALSGQGRYFILEALQKRLDYLDYRLEHKTPGRRDLVAIRGELQQFLDMLSDDAKVHINNAERLGQEMAMLLAWPT